jgi:hypothetical protein
MTLEPTVHDAPDVRHLRLRGGPGDGQTWAGQIAVGRTIACAGPWSPDGVYVVTTETVTAPNGQIENIAVPVGVRGRD